MKKGLEQLRKDWQTPAGRYFFESLDAEWEIDINKFVRTIDMFAVVLQNTIDEFKALVEEANRLAPDFDS